MSQLAEKLNTKPQETTPSAEASIQTCKALFDGAAIRRNIRKLYNSLDDKDRWLILSAGGLSPKENFSRKFEDFDDLELQKVRKGMQFLKEMTVRFDNSLSDVRRLKHSQFSSTH